jgi:hypothetical protein
VQISKYQLIVTGADGNKQTIETSSKATSKYSYGKLAIEIPRDAQRLLSWDMKLKK